MYLLYSTGMVQKIRKGARGHGGQTLRSRVFIREWMNYRGLVGTEGEERLAGRIDVARETVNRWINHPKRLSLPMLQAVADALDCTIQDLFRHPEQPSADALLRNAPEEVQKRAIRSIAVWLETGT